MDRLLDDPLAVEDISVVWCRGRFAGEALRAERLQTAGCFGVGGDARNRVRQ
jgi:hypothetical protein